MLVENGYSARHWGYSKGVTAAGWFSMYSVLGLWAKCFWGYLIISLFKSGIISRAVSAFHRYAYAFVLGTC